jgi:hypothetical protein
MTLTDKKCVAGGKKVHGLMGGAKATNGLYFRNWTWCGVERQSLVLLVETDAAVDCARCLKAMAAFERRHSKKDVRPSAANAPADGGK